MDITQAIKSWVSGWANRTFWPRRAFQKTNRGTQSGLAPILTKSDGTIDVTFLTSTTTAEYISDTVGTMVTGNTETGISVTYQDSDNTLDFDAQTAGDARYGQLGAANAWSGTNDFGSTVTLSKGSQDYTFTDRSTSLTLQGQTSGNPALLEIYAKDGDGTDSVQGQYWGVGTPASVANRERLLFGWDTANSWYFVNTENAGSGTLRALRLYTGTTTAQLVLATDGNVGVGIAPTTQLSMKAGTSSNDAAVGGVLYVDSGDHTSPGTTSKGDLSTYTVPANTLAVNNQELVFEAWFSVGADTDTRTIRLEFGTDIVTAITGGASLAGTMIVRGRITRTGAATQNYYVESITDIAAPTLHQAGSMTRTLSGSNVLKFTGQSSVSGGDIIQKYFKVWWEDANT